VLAAVRFQEVRSEGVQNWRIGLMPGRSIMLDGRRQTGWTTEFVPEAGILPKEA